MDQSFRSITAMTYTVAELPYVPNYQKKLIDNGRCPASRTPFAPDPREVFSLSNLPKRAPPTKDKVIKTDYSLVLKSGGNKNIVAEAFDKVTFLLLVFIQDIQ